MAIQAVSMSSSAIFEQARQGLDSGERKLNKAASAIASGDFSSNPILEMANAETMYGANAKVIQAHDEMSGNLLDTKS